MGNRGARSAFIIFVIGGLVSWGNFVFADATNCSLLPFAGLGDCGQVLSGLLQGLDRIGFTIASKFNLFSLAALPFQHIPEIVTLIILTEIGLIFRDWAKYR